MTETELNKRIEELALTDRARQPAKELRRYRREMKRRKYMRLRKIVTSSYVPHVGYVQWTWVNGEHLPTGQYIKYPKNSSCQRWMKRTTGKAARHCKDIPRKGNYYRRLFDYWWTLY